jgi:hypothetical protein
MFRRWLLPITLLSAALFGGCTGLASPPGIISFKYSLWRDNGDGTFSDVGCINAGVTIIRADLFLKGINAGGAESVCGAFGNGDGISNIDELGEFFAELAPTSFDQLQITAIQEDGSLLSFGLRVTDADRPAAEQQSINFPNPVVLSSEQQLSISLPGEAGSQVDNELQMIIP